MSSSSQDHAGRVIDVSGERSIRHANEMAAELLDALEAGDVRLDAARSGGMDAAALQVLVASGKFASGRGRSFVIHAPEGGALRGSIARAGLGEALAPVLDADPLPV
ncbi:STAS domain-containing protein [Fulvimarina endophytica]|nr:STAS domain-containing protein [Fulvimarina endophytica]